MEAEEKQHKSRRRFLQTLSGLGTTGLVASVIPSQVFAKPAATVSPATEDKHVFLTEPYLQAPGPDHITVMWIANLPSYNWIEYGETTSLGMKASSMDHGLVDTYGRINRITLNGLKPNTRYYYRIFSKEITTFEPYKLEYGETIQSDRYYFETPKGNPEKVNMLIMNDIHDRPYSFQDLMKLNGNDPFDFLFLNGDMFDYQTDEQQIIDHLIKPCTAVFASQRPFMYVRGNHETRGKYRNQLSQYFYNPQGRQYFDFTWGPVHFTVIDTGEDKPDDEPVYAGLVAFDEYREEQARWAETVMQSTAFKRAKFRVVLMHIPQYYSGDWHGTMHVQKLFSPIFNKAGVDLSISGHTHRYGVFDPVRGKHNYPIIIGGGPLTDKRTLIKLKADKKNLHLSMLRDDGVEVGKYHLVAKR